jgi:hypothetical protein
MGGSQVDLERCWRSCSCTLRRRMPSSPTSSSESLHLFVHSCNKLMKYYRITIAALISFTSRGLSTTDYFCYEALSSAGVVLVLPGYIIRESWRPF